MPIGRAQQLINQMLQATPEKPVKLPIQPIETEVILPPETMNKVYTILGVAGAITIGAILINQYLKR